MCAIIIKAMRKRLLCLLLSGIIAFAGLFAVSQNVYADPVPGDPGTSITTPPDETTDAEGEEGEETEGEATEEQPQTCYDQVGAIGWLVCPTTGFLSKLVDGVYGIIQSLLQVNPVSTDQDSPIYVVWEYVRNLTNIIFIIFLIVVIYSQLTGFGLNNYGIKKVLPRIVVAAILVNLSFIICALAVDVSNVLGASLRGVFTSIQESAIANGAINPIANFSIAEVVGAALGTAAVGTGAVIAGLAITGGIGAALWMLLPIILAGVVAVIAALITLAARQALVLLLIMIAPLAFVAYLLPNTESWFKKWKDLFMRMLIFYPMFSVLFGASQLAGWVIITAATNWFGVILGIAVQILPLFFAFPLMKMSGTILGRVNDAVRRPFAPAQSALKNLSGNAAAMRKAEYTRKALQRGPSRLEQRLGRRIVNPLSASSWRAFGTNLGARTADRKSQAEEDTKLLANERLNARKMGTDIIGYRKDGTPIYSSKPTRANKMMRDEYAHRTHKLRASNAQGDLDNVMSTMGDHMKNNKIDTSKSLAAQIKAMTDQQAQNYLDSVTIAKATARNDLADKRFYYDAVISAGADKNSEAYKKLILKGAGADGLSDDSKIRNDALTGVVSDAYSMFEAERKALRDKYNTYYTKQKTKDVLDLYRSNLEAQNIDAIMAAHEVLAFRGDFDKIGAMLQQKMDEVPGYVQLGSDFANMLASSLLGMKDKDPALARLGKHINMETWKYSNDNSSRASFVTMEEFITGVDATGRQTKTGGIRELLKGTSMKGIERTAFGNIQELVANTHFANDAARAAFERELTEGIMPQLVTAIPTFESGGEQILNTVSYLTGLQYRDGSWRDTDKHGNRLTPRIDMVEKYLGAFTPNDLANMKTDAFQGTMKAIQVAYGCSETDAHIRFRNIQEAKGNLDVLRGNQQVVSAMKPAVRNALGLNITP
jgi:MFS family permease